MPPDALLSRLGYRFSDTRLARQAITHRSYGVPNNERLEFLGDGVLNCAVARLLYDRFADLSEGHLSRLRASLVNQDRLCAIATGLELGERLLLGEGELKSGGFRRPSILGDAFEALLGAIYLDGGFDAAFAVIGTLYAPLLAELDPSAVAKDPKTLLQEHLQGRRLALPQYNVVRVTGETHEQRFEVECLIPQLAIRATGEGSSRRNAEQSAARSAYARATVGQAE